MNSLHNFMFTIMKYQTMMFTDSLFIHYRIFLQYFEKLYKSVSLRKSNLKFFSYFYQRHAPITKKITLRENHTSYLSVFSPNTGKYGPEKTPYFNTFTHWQISVAESLLKSVKKIFNVVCFIESPLKMTKNAFFILRSFRFQDT